MVRESRGTVLLVVADGVGGGPGGEIAADAAVQELAHRFFARSEGTIEERLADAFREANTAVLRAAEASGKPQAASTLVAAAVRGGRAVIANLGDSRAYLVRAGAARQLTQDHSGDIAHGITRFVGDPRGVQPDVFVEDLAPGDRLLLCSDGLTRHVSDEEIAMTMIGAMRMATLSTEKTGQLDKPPKRRPPELDGAADTLIGIANSRGGEDNITVALFVAEDRALLAIPPRRTVGLAIFIALVALVVAGTVALLASLAPYAPQIGPSVSPSASATATASPTATTSPTLTPTPNPTEAPSPTP